MRHEIGTFFCALTAVLASRATAGGGEELASTAKGPLGSSPRIVVLDLCRPFHWSESGQHPAGVLREDSHDVKDCAPRSGPKAPIVGCCA